MGKGTRELPGLTAQEIWDAHFRNELAEEEQTQMIVRDAGFLIEHEFDVWEFRDLVSNRTAWRDALDRIWLVDHKTEDIAEWER